MSEATLYKLLPSHSHPVQSEYKLLRALGSKAEVFLLCQYYPSKTIILPPSLLFLAGADILSYD